MSYPKLHSITECPKCGADRGGNKIKYVNVPKSGYDEFGAYWFSTVESEEEFIEVECKNCNYHWRESTLDA